VTELRTRLPIVVGVDGSPESAVAVRWAAAESARRESPLTAVLVWSYLDQPEAGFDPGYSERDAARALGRFLIDAVGADRAATVERRVICDFPANGLLDTAIASSLLVVGARGRGGFAGLHLGSVADRVTQRSPVPVAVVRGEDVVDARVVVGFDGSPTGTAALEWAAAEAALRGVPLEVLRAWEPPAIVDWAFLPDATVYRKLQDEAEAETADAISRIPSGVEIVTSFTRDGAARNLLEAASRASLLVVGRRGLGRLAAVAMGSVSRQVVHHATCPVIVLPPAD
jgi:nucleotide-binding universal stress UspA family protein